MSNVAQAKKLAFFIDHRGLGNRALGRNIDYGLRTHTSLTADQDQYKYKMIVDRDELEDDYFSVLKRITVPLLEVWAGANFHPEEWFTRDSIDSIVKYLQKEGSRVRLLGEPVDLCDVSAIGNP